MLDPIKKLWRLMTDRKITCHYCGRFLGFVSLRGHKLWACGDCSLHGTVEAL